MRPARLAAGGFLCALLGAVAGLGIAREAGWMGRETTRTVAVTAPSGRRAASAVDLPRIRPLLGNAFDPARIYELRSSGVVTIFSVLDGGETAQGSGFVVSPDGYLLTSSHVITDAGLGRPAQRPRAARRVYVEFADRDRVSAKVVGFDVFDDVGVLRVDPREHRLSPVPLGESSLVRVGEPVAAIGSPFGNENSLAVGVVSATRRSIGSLTSPYDLPDAIQVDAPINHGNSGGPVFDARGKVIGIAAQIRSTTGNAEGVGFAVPIDAARRSMRELIDTGSVSYAYVGIVTEDLTPTVARHFGLAVDRGALVDSVRGGSAGSRGGLRGGNRDVNLSGQRIRFGGDVIVAIDGRSVSDSEDVLRIVTESLRPRKVATFSVVRGAARLKLRVVPGERPENPNAG